MNNNWKNFTRTTGIYRILNKITNERYIGQSKDFGERWKQHMYMLRNNKHHCSKLQQSWNQYGYEAFSFEIVELCKKTELTQKEIEHWDKEQDLCFNARPKENGFVEHTEESKQKMKEAHTGKTLSEETKNNISKAKKGKKRKPRSEEHKQNMSIAQKGRTIPEETKAKMREAKKKYWENRKKLLNK